jgi:hypothetical protein
MRILENAENQQAAQQSQIMHPLHTISQSQINYARTLRKAELYDEAVNELSTIHAKVQVHPIDASLVLQENTKCMLKLAEKLAHQQKYGEKCVEDNKLTAEYSLDSYERLLNGAGPQVLMEKAAELLDAARIEALPNDQAARLIAVKAGLKVRKF